MKFEIYCNGEIENKVSESFNNSDNAVYLSSFPLNKRQFSDEIYTTSIHPIHGEVNIVSDVSIEDNVITLDSVVYKGEARINGSYVSDNNVVDVINDFLIKNWMFA